MKLFLLALALTAVAAEPESLKDIYGRTILPGYTTGYTGLVNPAFTNAGLISPYVSSSLYPNIYSNIYGVNRYINPLVKREADSEADPLTILPYGNIYGRSILPGYTTGYTGLVNPAYTTTGLIRPYATSAVYPNIYSNVYGLNRYINPLVKRDADSDAGVVYTDGQFHTNVENVGKIAAYAKPFGSVYSTYTPSYKYVAPTATYSAISPYSVGYTGLTGYSGLIKPFGAWY